jgi:hypothetical protein
MSPRGVLTELTSTKRARRLNDEGAERSRRRARSQIDDSDRLGNAAEGEYDGQGHCGRKLVEILHSILLQRLPREGGG